MFKHSPANAAMPESPTLLLEIWSSSRFTSPGTPLPYPTHNQHKDNNANNMRCSWQIDTSLRNLVPERCFISEFRTPMHHPTFNFSKVVRPGKHHKEPYASIHSFEMLVVLWNVDCSITECWHRMNDEFRLSFQWRKFDWRIEGVPLRWTKPPWISGHRSRSRFLRLTKLSKLLIPAAVMRLLLQRLRVVRFVNPGEWAQKTKVSHGNQSNSGHPSNNAEGVRKYLTMQGDPRLRCSHKSSKQETGDWCMFQVKPSLHPKLRSSIYPMQEVTRPASLSSRARNPPVPGTPEAKHPAQIAI